MDTRASGKSSRRDGSIELWPLSDLIEYDRQAPRSRAVYDDIMATRKTDWINNFWKAIAHDPATLKRTWESIKQIMKAGRARPAGERDDVRRRQRLQRCPYCIASHTASARAKGNDA